MSQCLAFSCPAISCPATWSVNFMSCIFMSCYLVRHFHVLQFHALQLGPSISCPAISCPSFSAPPASTPITNYSAGAALSMMHTLWPFNLITQKCKLCITSYVCYVTHICCWSVIMRPTSAAFTSLVIPCTKASTPSVHGSCNFLLAMVRSVSACVPSLQRTTGWT